MVEDLKVKNLKEIKEILDKLGIKYWLEHGTLLMAVRDKRIKWGDIDLGTKFESRERIISAFPEFKKKGFNVFIHRYSSCGITLNRFGCETDIALYHLKGKNAWISNVVGENPIAIFLKFLYHFLSIEGYTPERTYFPANLNGFIMTQTKIIRKFRIRIFSYRFASLLPKSLRYGLRELVWRMFKKVKGRLFLSIMPKTYFEKLRNIKFYGMTFNVPSKVEDYLRYRFGDWRTPKKEWEWWKEDGSVRPLSQGVG